MSLATVGVVGAGTMGNGIAQVCASAGLTVRLLDISREMLDKAAATIDKNLGRRAMEPANKLAVLARIELSTDYGGLQDADIVIEAATEHLSLKQDVLKRVVQHVSPQCVIATNTSSLSITQLAAKLSHPERFIGVHFFNPVPVMQLIEVVRGLRTSDHTYTQVLALAARLDKVAITSANRPGFVVNRILVPMINEAVLVYQEGIASAKDIDSAMVLGCNQPLGPLALADLIGLDTVLAILESLYAGFSDSKYRPASMLRELVAAGDLGRKTGRGFYDYG
ncbi:3-hydroxyacyl-CoA dehydrogenase NAD-binding domain-containing protein [Pseudomonas fluorescens]|uniref:3-hydroxyacyl-CoA dehydrogenase NAD-binding domain-containing protein n=1 Tax=Pseudomonas fluorescens TaxID=294 RepID=UPI00125616FE|nr:3-hydroxyacyl-CoA dehydrogenase NAD-binding domain-containing protein [Pseudomonas fluorescens]VVN69960.1 3-hydroxybutyryl-CoA dehydrogenase [Pseudomonas fluorescens]